MLPAGIARPPGAPAGCVTRNLRAGAVFPDTMPSMAHLRALAGACALLLLLVAAPIASAASTGGASTGSTPAPAPSTPAATSTSDPLAGNGMWIWNIPNTERGDPVAIGARARKAGLSFVVVKAAHGATRWSGFTAPFIAALHAQGLKVCGYQRVQSTAPTTQAKVLAAQVRLGADCAVIDAESELEGRYATATTYMRTLRAGLGTRFPIALTSFPWIGYHTTFPYSVFLGPGGAQVNMPQIYWKDIGVTVDTAFANTYPSNSVFGRPIRPIGQLYQRPSGTDIQRFRTLTRRYGSTGQSWWVWEQAQSSAWTTLGKPAPATTARAVVPPTLRVGARTDLVRWARIRLARFGAPVNVTSPVFDAALRAAVTAFQGARGLPQTGAVDPATWAKLIPVYALRR